MTFQSVVACFEMKEGDLLVACQLIKNVLVWVVSSRSAVEIGYLFVETKSLGFFVVGVIGVSFLLPSFAG